VVSSTNGREIVITFGQDEAPALALRPPAGAFPAGGSTRAAHTRIHSPSVSGKHPRTLLDPLARERALLPTL